MHEGRVTGFATEKITLGKKAGNSVLIKGDTLEEEKTIWRGRLEKWFIKRIKEKRGFQSARQWWYNTKDKFNKLLTEVAKEHNIELKKWPPDDTLLPSKLWGYLFMEVDGWANDRHY